MANTTDFMGKNQLVDRLAAQLRVNGMTGDTRAAAMDILKRRGHLNGKGELTADGRARDGMTAEERAIDRAKRAAPGAQFVYNPNTNRATRR
jgi:hypothetical protein